jgi:hypothetical protein
MVTALDFQSCRIATISDSEEACLMLADGVVMAVLVRLDRDAPDEPGWYLQVGFGPCDQEGLLFESTAAAAAWVEQRLAVWRDNETARLNRPAAPLG